MLEADADELDEIARALPDRKPAAVGGAAVMLPMRMLRTSAPYL